MTERKRKPQLIEPSREPFTAWRSMLFVPAHIDRYIESASKSSADAIQLDLEDGVPIEKKDKARQNLTAAINRLSEVGREVIVRINSDIGMCAKDIEASVTDGVHAISLPKAKDAGHVALVDDLIGRAELSHNLPVGRIELIATIETADAFFEMRDIARASHRMNGLALGSEDFSLSCGFEPTTDNLKPYCHMLVAAARAAGVHPYGVIGSIAAFRDRDAFTSMVEVAKSMGFVGGFCVHPSQVEPLNKGFSFTDEELLYARKVIDAFERQPGRRNGSVEVDGRMVDLPVVERARNMISKQERQRSSGAPLSTAETKPAQY